MQIGSLGEEAPLKEDMATHPSILAWRTPWTEEPGGLQSVELQRTVLSHGHQGSEPQTAPSDAWAGGCPTEPQNWFPFSPFFPLATATAFKWEHYILPMPLKVKVKSLSRVRLFATPWTVTYQALRPWDSPGKNTGVGCHFLLQGIFPTQGLNPGLPACRQTL